MKTLVRELGLRPRGVVHVGAHLAEERKAYEAAGVERVVWIEANPELIPALIKAARGKCESIVVQAVLTDRDGDPVTFHIANNGQSSSVLEPALHRKHHPKVKFERSLSLATTTLGAVVRQHAIDLSRYDFLNLDIQGAELLALRGAGELVRTFRAIYTEVNSNEIYAGCARVEELDDWLAGHGFVRVKTKMTSHEWGDAVYLRSNGQQAS